MVYLSYILLRISSNIQCGIFVSNTPPRDDESLSVNLEIFGQGSLGRLDR